MWNIEMIKLFIGTSEVEDRWIEQIYLYSLFKNTKEKLDITFLRPSMFKDWNTKGWGTPFTCFRYAVPELMGFKGRAIYTDVDQLNFRDISELYIRDPLKTIGVYSKIKKRGPDKEVKITKIDYQMVIILIIPLVTLYL